MPLGAEQQLDRRYRVTAGNTYHGHNIVEKCIWREILDKLLEQAKALQCSPRLSTQPVLKKSRHAGKNMRLLNLKLILA